MDRLTTPSCKPGFWSDIHPVMAIGSALLVVFFVLFTVINPDYAGSVFNSARDFIASNLSWYYISLMNFYLLFALLLLFSKYGKIRLGANSDKPEFSYFAWFSMLFGAGIGIGILFWSIAEPIFYLQGNPFISDAQSMTPEAAQVAMRVAIFHWGLHGWGLYAVLGMTFAYFSYRKGLPLSIRSALYPIFGERIYGPIGYVADLLALLGTVFGIATSLGLGAQQMNAGLNYLLGIEISIVTQILLIAIISIVATASVLSGVNKGIRILSELNMTLTLLILGLFVVFGPTLYLLSAIGANTVDYIINAPALGVWLAPTEHMQWQSDWTIFYWGWWLAWSPFTGIFIARISRGRTIREFLLGVLLVPTALTILWITIFGNSAMYIELFGEGGVAAAVNADTTTALFKTIELLDLGYLLTGIMATICTFMLLTYFVTSADSATLVICTLVAMGKNNPPAKLRIFWGVAIGAVAAVLLYSGGLQALKTASIVVALPFSVVLIFATYGLCKSLYRDGKNIDNGEQHLIKPSTNKIVE
ncbi:MAG: choline/glycine/proline betaine transport protein [Paraglaciecola sp.]|jgi:choline/glycine/proline betaine transport protein